MVIYLSNDNGCGKWKGSRPLKNMPKDYSFAVKNGPDLSVQSVNKRLNKDN